MKIMCKKRPDISSDPRLKKNQIDILLFLPYLWNPDRFLFFICN